MISLLIFLDDHATTPVDPRVVETMLPLFTEKFGNAGSVNYGFGKKAACAVKGAVADNRLDARRYESYCHLCGGDTE